MYQKLIVVGILGKDPEMSYTPDAKAVTTFSMATNRRYNDKKETTWFRVSVWGRQAESSNQYLTKGSRVLVEGRLRPDLNTGNPRVFQKKDGSWGSSFEIFADNVIFLSTRSEGNPEADDTVDDDDIPF